LRVFNQGVNVLVPQLFMWDAPKIEEEREDFMEVRREMDHSLKQLGGSITALEIYELMCCLDYFEKQPYCDGRFAITGLSYGGFYSLYLAAADTRIRAALACSHFNNRYRYNFSFFKKLVPISNCFIPKISPIV
jgi:dienelactone hydrolase